MTSSRSAHVSPEGHSQQNWSERRSCTRGFTGTDPDPRTKPGTLFSPSYPLFLGPSASCWHYPYFIFTRDKGCALSEYYPNFLQTHTLWTATYFGFSLLCMAIPESIPQESPIQPVFLLGSLQTADHFQSRLTSTSHREQTVVHAPLT